MTAAPTTLVVRRRQERATVSVEWVLVLIVALVVLAGIYYISGWAMDDTKSTIKVITGS
jgi:uncharacterized protein (UPF0333 family)